MKKYFVDKDFIVRVLMLAIPLMLQQLVSVAVNLVDNLMVGFLGDAAIASVAAVNRFYMIAAFGINGVTAAGSVFIAQYFGAREKQKMKESFRMMLVTAVIIMLLFTVGGNLFPRQILQFFTSDEEVIFDGVKYIQIAIWSYIPAAITMSIYNAMRSVGQTQIPLKTSITAVLVNCVLNYVFMFGKLGFPAMGVAGAALATAVARYLEVVLAIWSLNHHDFDFRTKFSHIHHISTDIRNRVLSKAAPLVTNEVLWSLGMAMLFKFYSTRGSEVMSGYSICSTVGDLFFTLFAGMAAATTVLVSQSLGANRLDEARANGYKLMGFSFMLAILFGVMMYFTAGIIPLLYRNVSVEAQNIAMSYLHVQAFMFWNYMLTTECYFILRAGGDMKHTLMMDSGFMWLLTIPVLAFVTYFTNFNYLQIYLVSQVTDFLKLLFANYQVRKEHWVVNLTAVEEK